MSTDEPKYVTGRRALEQWRKSDPKERQTLELYYKYRDELEAYPGVMGVGYGEVVTVIVYPKASAADKARIPRKLEGCDIEVIEQGPARIIRLFKTEHRPLVGGIQS